MNENYELFPAFLFKRMTREECQSLNTPNCNVSHTSNNCPGDGVIRIDCNGNGTTDEFVTVATKIKELDKSRPVRYATFDNQTAPEIFQPIRKSVISLYIYRCLNQLTTAKLPTLNIPNLIYFALWHCNGMVIRKEDFAQNTRLRMIDFQQDTIEDIELGTFTNLPNLQYLSLDGIWKRPFTPEYTTHLLRFHCDCQYSWLRKWMKQNPVLISPKFENEIYRIGNYRNFDLTRKVTFVPVDCSFQNLNNATFDGLQVDYSANDLCQ